MTRRCVVALLAPPTWSPPGVDRTAWGRALAEDTVDLLATLATADPALAAGPDAVALAEAVRWPSIPVLELPRARPADALRAAAAQGYDEVAVIAGDVPDLPGMLIGKLLQPLDRRTVAAAPAAGGAGGLWGIAATLPAPGWLLALDPDLDTAAVGELRRAAPGLGVFAVAPGWHRLRDPDSFARLDPGLEGWDATRALLSPAR